MQPCPVRPSGSGQLSEVVRWMERELQRLQPVPAPGDIVTKTPRGMLVSGKRNPVHSPARITWFIIKEVLRDFILCHPVDSRMWVANGLTVASYILVGKPIALRTQWLSGGTGSAGGFDYEDYSAAPAQYRYRVHSTYSPERDLEQIYPRYSTGDLIAAREILNEIPTAWNVHWNGHTLPESLGLVTSSDITPSSPPTATFPAGTVVEWLDLNIDARRWASAGLLTGDRATETGGRVIGYE